MDAIDRESRAALSAVRCTSPICQSQEIDFTDLVEVSSLHADGAAWRAQGVVMFDYCVHGRCRTCGRVFEAAKKQIPLHFPELACPQCDRQGLLTYRVEGVTKTADGFQFTATVRCTGCEAKNRLKQVLTGLFSALSVEVGLTGISLKRAR